MKKNLVYPARINKYLAFNNFCTRREADALIKAKRVKINGRLAVLGDKVGEDDEVTVDKSVKHGKKMIYLAYNKPRGIVTHSPQKGEKSIAEVFKHPLKVFPVGRLDKDSHGLILLTNDGRIIDRLLNPDYDHEKEYVVTVDRTISPSFVSHMASGVELENRYMTKKCQVKNIDSQTFSIILTEGKKHQIRRMCEKLGRSVIDLKRTRIMNIKLGDLKRGEGREITNREQEELLEKIGINKQKIKVFEEKTGKYSH